MRHWVAFAYLLIMGGGCMHGVGRLLSHELVVVFMLIAEQLFSRAERLCLLMLATCRARSENTEIGSPAKNKNTECSGFHLTVHRNQKLIEERLVMSVREFSLYTLRSRCQ